MPADLSFSKEKHLSITRLDRKQLSKIHAKVVTEHDPDHAAVGNDQYRFCKIPA